MYSWYTPFDKAAFHCRCCLRDIGACWESRRLSGPTGWSMQYFKHCIIFLLECAEVIHTSQRAMILPIKYWGLVDITLCFEVSHWDTAPRNGYLLFLFKDILPFFDQLGLPHFFHNFPYPRKIVIIQILFIWVLTQKMAGIRQHRPIFNWAILCHLSICL